MSALHAVLRVYVIAAARATGARRLFADGGEFSAQTKGISMKKSLAALHVLAAHSAAREHVVLDRATGRMQRVLDGYDVQADHPTRLLHRMSQIA